MNVTLAFMESDVKPSGTRRRYDTTRRAAAAAETRRAVLSAARALFLERGYSATTVAAIADSAGVAVDTVYASVGPKSTLFRLLIETALSGTDQPLRADDRDYVHSIHEEPDAARKLAIYARAVSSIHERLAPLFVVLRDAAQGNRTWPHFGPRSASDGPGTCADLSPKWLRRREDFGTGWTSTRPRISSGRRTHRTSTFGYDTSASGRQSSLNAC